MAEMMMLLICYININALVSQLFNTEFKGYTLFTTCLFLSRFHFPKPVFHFHFFLFYIDRVITRFYCTCLM